MYDRQDNYDEAVGPAPHAHRYDLNDEWADPVFYAVCIRTHTDLGVVACARERFWINKYKEQS